MCLVCHSSSHNIASKMLLKLPVIVETVSYLPRVPSKKKTKKQKKKHSMESQPIEIYFLYFFTGLQIWMQGGSPSFYQFCFS